MILGIITTYKDYLKYLGESSLQNWNDILLLYEQLKRSTTETKTIELILKDFERTSKLLFSQFVSIEKTLENNPKAIDAKNNVARLIITVTNLLEIISEQIRMIEKTPFLEKTKKEFLDAKIYLALQKVKKEIRPAGEAYFNYQRRGFFRKAGRLSLKGLVALIAVPGGLTAAYTGALCFAARNLKYEKEGLAILISGDVMRWYESIAKVFSPYLIPAYTARVELAFGQKALIVKVDATSQDLLDVFENEKIQNIVLFGHGSWSTWSATDVEVKSELVQTWAKDLEKQKKFFKRTGFLVRHTCGSDRARVVDKITISKKELYQKVQPLIDDFNEFLEQFFVIKELENVSDAFEKERNEEISTLNNWISKKVQEELIKIKKSKQPFIDAMRKTMILDLQKKGATWDTVEFELEKYDQGIADSESFEKIKKEILEKIPPKLFVRYIEGENGVNDFLVLQMHGTTTFLEWMKEIEEYPARIDLFTYNTVKSEDIFKDLSFQKNIIDDKINWMYYLSVLHPEKGDIIEKWTNVINAVIDVHLQAEAVHENSLFGLPFFTKENIKGWDRVAYPWDYLKNVFGEKPEDLTVDRVYTKNEEDNEIGEFLDRFSDE